MDYSFFDFLRLIGSLALFLYGVKGYKNLRVTVYGEY